MMVAEAPAQAPSAKLPSPPDVAAAPAVVSEPVKSVEIAPPPVPEPMMGLVGPAAAPSAPPAIASHSNPASKLAALRADPSVVWAPVRKDDEAPVAPHPVVRAEAPVPVKPVEQKFAPPAPKPAPEAKPAALASSSGAYFVQAGAYFSEERAGVAASALDRLGAHVTSGVNDGRAVYRVRIGPFLTIQQAKAAFTQAQAMGHADLRSSRNKSRASCIQMETFVIPGRAAVRREGKESISWRSSVFFTEWMPFPRASRSPGMTALIPCDRTLL